mmetsp:Transcript_104333/g.276499  ORF Transcript_104333/g.276499 Transcript_104333/m.276499 type:complete len:102 (+) Transcript_104333:1722-2027(+)
MDAAKAPRSHRFADLTPPTALQTSCLLASAPRRLQAAMAAEHDVSQGAVARKLSGCCRPDAATAPVVSAVLDFQRLRQKMWPDAAGLVMLQGRYWKNCWSL